MSYKLKNSKVLEITKMNITGNVVPISWFEHLKFDKGKPHLPAIMILSDIIYWYRAEENRDEDTGMLVESRQKFKADMLQKQYKLWMELYGFGKTQTKNAVDYLEEKGLINREFRNVELESGEILYNRMFVEPIPTAIAEITYPHSNKSSGGSFENEEGVISKLGSGHSETREDPISKSGGGHSKVNNTETTTESTTETTTNSNNNNKKAETKISKLLADNFKKAFGKEPNDFQKQKLSEFIDKGGDFELMLKTIEYCALGGHNQTFFFRRLDILIENGIYKKEDLKKIFRKDNVKTAAGDSEEVKNNEVEDNYKWKDFFIDFDKYKE